MHEADAQQDEVIDVTTTHDWNEFESLQCHPNKIDSSRKDSHVTN